MRTKSKKPSKSKSDRKVSREVIPRYNLDKIIKVKRVLKKVLRNVIPYKSLENLRSSNRYWIPRV